MGVQTDQSPGAAVAEPPPSADVDAAVADTRPLPPDEAIDAWAHVKRAFAALLRNPAPDAAWVESLQALKQRMRVLARRDFDTALYLLMQDAAAGEDRYSAHHSLLCALVAEVCADWYEWSPAEMDALVLSALSMNVSMSAMQDALTRQVQPLSPAATSISALLSG
jgi:HD-GYP domain-containing protein (c-di-GMP phosphodiesterase class II)